MNTQHKTSPQGGLLRPALAVFAILTVVTGLAYPYATTGVSQLLFPREANGSLIEANGQVVGSTLIGQQFSAPKYFWGRLSATGPMPYNASASSGSNLGPRNPALADAAKARIDALRTADPGNTRPIPVDLVSASGSGLDPDISVAAADYQIARVAKARNMSTLEVAKRVEAHTRRPFFGLLGEPVVNVLALNLDLDGLKATR
ncbi:potassium-transporting ATPase subunit KdpC [Bordetella bronchialis]|uniref:Potassium-transporting ATPase KdpC subunit n=1 Tax=Bordetella bronchialis TaxID=463025 RepID=A0A193G645_9BORD|nr:potassium-transporting ATPase subunit KdpC [Bordetella bronchialis]ANN74941.1 K+-transporting ATPase subunit C [Bordetella bronchialis]